LFHSSFHICSRHKMAQEVDPRLRARRTTDVPNLPLWAEALNKPIMYFYEDESADWQQRAMDILRMFPDNQIGFVLHMLKNMALSMHEFDV
ncbi:MAG: hypothetical protein KC708_18525, partial [Anaerolineae bacterium]|nr:hypothetical protein [Anaerolineae bacterium]